MIRAVLFDFDGTLMDTDEVVLRSWEEAYRGMGRPVPERTEIRTTFGEPLVYSMQRLFPDVDYKIPLGIYRTYNEANFLSYSSPYPGMVELIDRLRARGILTALVTARLRRTTYIGLEHFDLVRRFDAILTEDDLKESKPDPAPVYETLRRLGVAFEESPSWAAEERVPSQKESVIMLGDSVHDIHCCENAGIGSMLVGWTNTLTIEDAECRSGLAAAAPEKTLRAVTAHGEAVHPDYILYQADAFGQIL